MSLRRPASLDELAVSTGVPAFSEPVHVGRPNIGDRGALLERIEGALDRRWLTNEGELNVEFEARVAALTGADHCVAVVNATIGLQLVAKALGLSGEVVMPSWTFIGTAHALSWIGLEPVFCDIEAVSHNLDPAAVERAITPETSAILGVHLWGRPCDVDALVEIAERHELALMFDAAHALGCTYHGRPIGAFGVAEVFSFHATKIANAAEGGAITTNDAELAQRMRLMRAFGFCAYDTVSELGTNAKMNELSAAMGLTSLDSLDQFTEISRLNHQAYARGLKDIDGLRLLDYVDGEQHNYHYVVLELSDPGQSLTRDELVSMLHAENVLARRYFHPGCHRLEPYASVPLELPVTENISSRVVALPTGTSISEEAIETICSIIAVAMRNGADVRRRLER